MKLPFGNIYMYYSRCCGKKDTIFVLLTIGPYGNNKGKKFQIFGKKIENVLNFLLIPFMPLCWRGGRVVEGAPLLRE